MQSACPIVPPSAGKTYAAPPVRPIAVLLAEAGILEEEEERCCDQAKACSKCPCSGTTATSDAPCCEVSDYAVSACDDDACEEEDDDCSEHRNCRADRAFDAGRRAPGGRRP